MYLSGFKNNKILSLVYVKIYKKSKNKQMFIIDN